VLPHFVLRWLIERMFGQVFDRLRHLFDLWRAGLLPPAIPTTPREAPAGETRRSPPATCAPARRGSARVSAPSPCPVAVGLGDVAHRPTPPAFAPRSSGVAHIPTTNCPARPRAISTRISQNRELAKRLPLRHKRYIYETKTGSP
jgi:hypothetical protein